ncbi:MAG: hypothetical protein IT259_03305 [Saprospiraceae bacterium]|nr:hypothetical protein [Saprospiraceae bacterium]
MNFSPAAENRYQSLANSAAVNALTIVSTTDPRAVLRDGRLAFQIPGAPDTLLAQGPLIEENNRVGFRWSGTILNAPGYVTFDVREGQTGGYIMAGSDYYELIPADSTYQFLVKKARAYSPCAIGEEPKFELPHDITPTPMDQCAYEPDYETCPALISILVLVTPSAQQELANSWGGIGFFIKFGEAMVNQAFYNSDIPNKEVRVEYVLIDDSGFNYSTLSNPGLAAFNDLTTLQSWPTALTERANHNADLVFMLVGSDWNEASGGIATLPGAPSAQSSFSIVEVGWYLSEGAFCHELGHLFGCRHNWTTNLGNDDVTVCAHARRNIVFSDPPLGNYDIYSWRTIVGVPEAEGPILVLIDPDLEIYQEYQFHENWILHYSNPEIFFQGAPTGLGMGEVSDNAQQIRNSGYLVANHYPQQELSVFASFDQPANCGDRTFSVAIVTPEPGLPGIPPYTVSWYWNTSGVFDYPGQSSTLLGTGTSLTVADPTTECGVYYVKCIVQSSDHIQVSRILAVKMDPACCDHAERPAGRNDAPRITGTDTAALRIFPNPASDVLYLSQGADPVVFFEILDQYGRQLSSGNMETSAGEVSAINLPKSLPDGLLYLRTRQHSGAVQTSKLFTTKR